MNIKEKLEKYYAKQLDKLQEKINKKYEKKGLTNTILKAQIFVNKQRNKYDIPDPNEEKLFMDYVQ